MLKYFFFYNFHNSLKFGRVLINNPEKEAPKFPYQLTESRPSILNFNNLGEIYLSYISDLESIIL